MRKPGIKTTALFSAGVSVYTNSQSYVVQADIVAEACGAEHAGQVFFAVS